MSVSCGLKSKTDENSNHMVIIVITSLTFRSLICAFNCLQGGISNGMSAKSIRRELSPNSEDESPATVKFIKMSCKYFTDGMVRSLENMVMSGNNYNQC